MIGESKPNFALDLSNEGIALWHRASGGTWDSLGHVALDAPDFAQQVAHLRDSAGGGTSARARRTVVRIPRSEVMLDKVSLGVFEGEAAERHARKQIAALTPYTLEEIAFDLGDKGFGNMAPVGIVARKTLAEAEEFAKTNGFEPVYFTTQYASKEFPREPRFYNMDSAPANKSMWFVPWVAAASVGLAIGYFGYSSLSSNRATEQTTLSQFEQPVDAAPAETPQIASVEPKVQEPDPEPKPIEIAQLGLDDIAPSLPPIVGTLNAPDVTSYPEILTTRATKSPKIETPVVVRLQVEEPKSPLISISSKEVKTSSLQIAEAKRDLPDVALNDEIVTLIQSGLAVMSLDAPTPDAPIQLASLTAPNQNPTPVAIVQLPTNKDISNGVSSSAATPADRPPPPPSLVTAEPGTLTPTPDGTLGPENILIYSGPPPVKSRIRPGTPVIEPDPLAGFRPRLRPDTLVPQPPVVEVEEPPKEQTLLSLADPALRSFSPRYRPENLVPVITAEDETAAQIAQAALTTLTQEPPSILDLADPALKPFRPRVRPATLTVLETEQPDLIAEAIEADTQDPVTPTLLSLADPALKPFRPRTRPETLVVPVIEPSDTTVDAIETDSQEPTLLALADPSLQPFRAKIRPADFAPPKDLIAAAIEQDTVVQAIQQDALVQAIEQDSAEQANILLALADPTLSGKKAKARPTALRIVPNPKDLGLLALADPQLTGKKAKSRPANLRIIAEPEPVPVVEPLEEVVPANTIASATRNAIASSPKPKSRPSRLARVAKRVRANDADLGSGGTTESTAKTPKAAKGSSKPAPGPTPTTVARAATEKSKFRKSKMSLVGVFGTPSARRALVRLSSGRYVKVQKGDRVSGWKISAIGESSLRINKGSRNQVLRMP